jgi:hypothetical protein
MLNTYNQRVLIEGIVGTRKALPFRLRRKGQVTNWDVASASLIQIEYNRIDEGPSAPIVFNPSDSRADWTNGLVTGDLDPSTVTARTGAYQFILAVYLTLGAPPLVACRGEFQILYREPPGFVFAVGGLAYDGFPVWAFNGTNAVIPAGTPVSVIDGVMTPATDVGPGYLQATGLTIAAVPVDCGGCYVPANNITLPNWTAIIGTTHLTPSAPYYLGPSGTLVTPAPVTVGNLNQLVGTATSTTNLALSIDPNPLPN